VRPENVDDVVQDILLRLHERAAELRDEQKLAGWAFCIAKSVVTDHHRRANGPTKVTFGLTDDLASSARVERSDDENENEMVAGWLLPMVSLLPDEYAEALEVCDLGGVEQRVYAERKGLSISGAKSRVQRGRRILEELVRACCDLEQDVRGNVIGITRRGRP
jgi:RNA polymerase sigma-70 factor (ECF subfamily)